jgi:hypothetical protein
MAFEKILNSQICVRFSKKLSDFKNEAVENHSKI